MYSSARNILDNTSNTDDIVVIQHGEFVTPQYLSLKVPVDHILQNKLSKVLVRINECNLF